MKTLNRLDIVNEICAIFFYIVFTFYNYIFHYSMHVSFFFFRISCLLLFFYLSLMKV